MIGFIGDVHGRFEDLFKIFQARPDITSWFQVGDLGGKDVEYPILPSNFYFIQGNHENWDSIAEYAVNNDSHYLHNGHIYEFSDGGNKFTVATLGGNYSSKFYTYRREKLSGDRVRHFLATEILNLLAESAPVTVLLTHEAASPFFKHGRDVGQPHITQIIEKLKPDIHIFGHHHYYKELDYNGVPSVGLEYAGSSIVLYDVVEDSYERVVL